MESRLIERYLFSKSTAYQELAEAYLLSSYGKDLEPFYLALLNFHLCTDEAEEVLYLMNAEEKNIAWMLMHPNLGNLADTPLFK